MIFRNCVGIEICGDVVKCVYLKSSLKGIFVGASEVWDTGPLDKASVVAERINSFLDGNEKDVSSLYMGIPSDRLIVKTISFPAVVKENLGDAIRYEIDKILPVHLDDIVYDFFPVESLKDSIRITVVFVKRKDMEYYLDIARKIVPGLTAVTLTSSAVHTLLLSKDFGKGFKELMVARPSGKGLEYSLSSLNGWLFGTAQNASCPGEFAKDFVSPWQDENFDLTERTVAVFNSSGESHSCSAGPADQDFIKLNPRDFGVPEEGLEGAYSLALLGFQTRDSFVNFLPENMRKVKDKRPLAVCAVLSALFMLSLIAFSCSWHYRQKTADRYLDSELSALKTKVAEVEQIRKEKELLEKRISDLSLVFKSKPKLLQILEQVSVTLPKDAWLKQLEFKENTLNISGVSSSSSRLIPLFEKTACFEDVHFVSPISKEKDGTEVFRLGMKIEESCGSGKAEGK